MAVYMIPDRIDLVVEPHALTDEDRRAISEAIKERKKQKDMSSAVERIRRALARQQSESPAPARRTT